MLFYSFSLIQPSFELRKTFVIQRRTHLEKISVRIACIDKLLNPQSGYFKIDAYLLNLVSHDF